MSGLGKHPIIPDMKFDLHSHSTASDGKLSPEAVLALAAESMVDLFALTDHDTIEGYRAVTNNKQSFQLISGIELSSVWSGVAVHIVGLDFNADHPAITEAVNFQRRVREERALIIDDRLAKKGMPNTLAGALKYCPDICQVGRPHFAEYLVEQGYVDTVARAFDKWLGSGKIGDVKSGWPDMFTVVKWIKDADGVAVLAHPLQYKLTFSKLKRLITVFKSAGGEAVEVLGQQAHPDQKQRLIEYVIMQGLAGSGGSDFHSPEWSWSKIGTIEPLPKAITPVWALFNNTEISEKK